MLHHVLMSDKPGDWDLKLPDLLWAYREIPNETTGLSPFQLVYGKMARGPLSVLRDNWVEEYPPMLNKSSTQYLESLKDNLKIAADIANKNCEKTQKAYTDQHNKHSRPKSFEVGDSVIVLMPDSNNKLLSQWIGPATVVLQISENSHNVLFEDGAVKTLHADKQDFLSNGLKTWG